MILAFMIDKYLIKQDGKKYIGIALLGIIICLYSVKTYSRNFTWKDDYTLFTTDVKTSTNSAKCNVSAGGLSIEEAKKQKTKEEKMKYIDQALTYLHKAANLYPKNDVVWLLLGNAHLETEKYNLSVEYYDQSLRLSPGYKDALNNLLYVAQVTHRNKQYPWSILAYKTLVRHQPNNTEHLIELSNLYDETNRIDTALVILNSIVEKKPDYYQAYSKIGEIYGKRLNQIDMAISYLKKAYAINPNDGSVNENLGVAYGIKGDFKESIKYMLNSIKLDPNNPQTYFNLSASYNRIGEKKLAAEYMNKAIAVQKSQQQKAKN
ncbi:MAG: hypothetical protein Q8880_01190 [Bacteroidota bacterium]|nr:hypothetical protein [Bacteroidota bacterium]